MYADVLSSKLNKVQLSDLFQVDLLYHGYLHIECSNQYLISWVNLRGSYSLGKFDGVKKGADYVFWVSAIFPTKCKRQFGIFLKQIVKIILCLHCQLLYYFELFGYKLYIFMYTVVRFTFAYVYCSDILPVDQFNSNWICMALYNVFSW